MVIQVNLSSVTDESIATPSELHWWQIIAMQTSFTGTHHRKVWDAEGELPKCQINLWKLKFVSGVQAGHVWNTERSHFKAGSGRIWCENGNKKKKKLQKHGMLESRSIGNGPAFGSFIVQTVAFVLVHVSCAFRSPCLAGSGRIRYDYLRRSIQNFSSGWGKLLVQALTLKPVLWVFVDGSGNFFSGRVAPITFLNKNHVLDGISGYVHFQNLS